MCGAGKQAGAETAAVRLPARRAGAVAVFDGGAARGRRRAARHAAAWDRARRRIYRRAQKNI